MARIVALAPDLFFASKIEATLEAAGHEVEMVSSVEDTAEAAGRAELVIVDLHADGLDPAGLAARLGGKPLLGFYSHVDVDTRAQAERAGFDLVVPRSRMARDMPGLVARLVNR
jgi:acetylornithine deacetylase/succinyl-diaminopimelate desuccinylase-like protein